MSTGAAIGRRSYYPGNFWESPLVWVALAFTAGIVLDHSFAFTIQTTLILAGVSLILWLCCPKERSIALLFLGGMILAAGMVRHHVTTRRVDANDVSRFLTEEPLAARLRGRIDVEPVIVLASKDPLRLFVEQDHVRFVLEVASFKLGGDWNDGSGLVQVTVPGKTVGYHVGDRVQVAGKLSRPISRGNPSDFDYAEMLRDQGIHSVLFVPTLPTPVIVEETSWQTSFFGWLGVIQAWGRDVIADTMASDQGVATALLLGDSSGMTGRDWEKYLRTGVIHVLAVSGQHLVVLAAVLEVVCRLLRIKRRTRMIFITLILIGYAFLTGGRPPAMRAAWMVLAGCGGILLRRQTMPANAFALAWLGIAVLHPADIFNTGCQMSFLCVLVIIWALSLWSEMAPEPDPMAELVRASRPLSVRIVLGFLRWLGWFYLMSLVLWAAIVPLGAVRYHMVPTVGLLIGPPVILLSEFALISGFLQLLLSLLFRPLALIAAWFTRLFLGWCEYLVDFGAALPGGHFYVPDLPGWWVAIFYVGLCLAITVPMLRQRWRWTIAGAVGWTILAAVFLWVPLSALGPARPFRCTFLAVGHGGCTVIETPGRRVLLYDAGAITGSDVTRRHIAPFLWQRGYSAIDEVVISHADSDHFNGLVELMEFFRVRQITTTPTFAERETKPVALTLKAIQRDGVPVRQVKRGDRWDVDEVSFQVLHPPAQGPDGPENARSLVLLVTQEQHTLLLTGDLQEPGLGQVLKRPVPRIDILMSPHHGSKTSNTGPLADWARASVVVSCQERNKDGKHTLKPYEDRGIPFLGTWPHGAVAIYEHEGAWRVETFRTKKVLDLR